jgi:phenylalanyl-tRNA synthetase beta chain
MSGTKVECFEKKNGQDVIELEITTNRADCLSLLGLAKEISALTGKRVTLPKTTPPPTKKIQNGKDKRTFDIVIQDKKACPHYTARLIENVQIKASPLKIQNYLDLVDARPINNAVDATNFVLFEMGQPLHAFDADKIKGGVVVVRRAKINEKFTGIDGVERVLDEKTLVIADSERPIAIAGVIGGKNTEVTDQTKNILLESAYFDPALVRQASKKYKISTESSYRFERGVDPQGVLPASARARDLIFEWGRSGHESLLKEAKASRPSKPVKINLNCSRVDAILGFHIPEKRMAAILNTLGFSAKRTSAGKLSVPVPSSRRDVALEEDLAEEVLRIEGFDKVPAAIPITRHTAQTGRPERLSGVFELKKYLAGLGFHEIVTYSLLSRKALEDACVLKNGDTDSLARKITNAVSAEQEYFRPSLLAGMANAIAHNLHRMAESTKFFEIGNVIEDGVEKTKLSLAIAGLFEDNWRRKSQASFFDLKGVLENLLGFLKVENARLAESAPGVLTLEREGCSRGRLWAISPQVLKNWDIAREVFYAELDVEALETGRAGRGGFKVKPAAKFPAARRDLAFVLDATIPVQALVEAMLETAKPFVKNVTLFDQYIGKNIPAGKRSLAFSLEYQKETATLTDEEINELQRRVTELLKNKYQAEPRA